MYELCFIYYLYLLCLVYGCCMIVVWFVYVVFDGFVWFAYGCVWFVYGLCMVCECVLDDECMFSNYCYVCCIKTFYDVFFLWNLNCVFKWLCMICKWFCTICVWLLYIVFVLLPIFRIKIVFVFVCVCCMIVEWFVYGFVWCVWFWICFVYDCVWLF